MSGSTLPLQSSTCVEVGKDVSTERTDGQPSPPEGNLFPSCLGNDMAVGKGVRELGQGRPFPIVSLGPVMALWCILLFPRQMLLRRAPEPLHRVF